MQTSALSRTTRLALWAGDWMPLDAVEPAAAGCVAAACSLLVIVDGLADAADLWRLGRWLRRPVEFRRFGRWLRRGGAPALRPLAAAPGEAVAPRPLAWRPVELWCLRPLRRAVGHPGAAGPAG